MKPKTIHVLNWLCPTKTVCNLSLKDRITTEDIKKITCDICALRILRTGQKLGLEVKDIMEWDFEVLKTYTGK